MYQTIQIYPQEGGIHALKVAERGGHSSKKVGFFLPNIIKSYLCIPIWEVVNCGRKGRDRGWNISLVFFTQSITL